MLQRGRKSAASLAAVALLSGEDAHPLPPPARLSEAEAKEWAAIVGSKPVGFFDAIDGILLELLVSTICTGHELARRAKAAMAKPDFKDADGLLAAYARQSSTIAMLAKKLGLTKPATRTPPPPKPVFRPPWEG
jgi:hypothetical protein